MTKRAIAVTRITSIGDQLAQWHEEIRLRAFHAFLGRGSSEGGALDDWLSAERELALEPAIEVKQEHDRIEIIAPLPDVDPRTLDVRVTAEDVLIKAELDAESLAHGDASWASGPAKVFRAIRLPAPIDADRIKAAYSNGQLRLIAPIKEQPARQVQRAR